MCSWCRLRRGKPALINCDTRRSALRSWYSTPGERAPDICWTGYWVGPRASLDFQRRLKFFATTGIRNPHRPARSLLSLYWLSYSPLWPQDKVISTSIKRGTTKQEGQRDTSCLSWHTVLSRYTIINAFGECDKNQNIPKFMSTRQRDDNKFVMSVYSINRN
jgi:hypothetical protein